MHIHTVFFWLTDCSDEDRLAFEPGLTRLLETRLRENQGVAHAWWGRPAGVDRDVVDGSYDYSLTVVFETRADHDNYQKAAEHQVFIDNHSHIWGRVQVYDSRIG